jgi:hypothetical protein
MLNSTGLVLAAGGIVVANELIFAPMEAGKTPNLSTFNWRIVPATAVLALTLGGLEKLSKPLGVGLAALTLLAILIVPVGKAPTPIDNASKLFGKGGL